MLLFAVSLVVAAAAYFAICLVCIVNESLTVVSRNLFFRLFWNLNFDLLHAWL